ncbi:hypothetical protein SCHPADRAFT_947514 [Schizopora paradoxa]|uniref:Uncharacterized protein n=1 Tax=Schizopora paradoxa TaxID=27342 RepID=A0A0H2R5D8_9AGAM|nr:hypothetical protein SCHPADRAFT_947514 [Schizopora paradoxa]
MSFEPHRNPALLHSAMHDASLSLRFAPETLYGKKSHRPTGPQLTMNEGNYTTHVFPATPHAPPLSTAIQHHSLSTQSPSFALPKSGGALGTLSDGPVLQVPPTMPVHARPALSGAVTHSPMESLDRTPGSNVSRCSRDLAATGGMYRGATRIFPIVDLVPRMELEPTQQQPPLLPAVEKRPKGSVRFALPTAASWISLKPKFPCNPTFIPPDPDARTIYNPGDPPPKYHPAIRHVGRKIGVRQRGGKRRLDATTGSTGKGMSSGSLETDDRARLTAVPRSSDEHILAARTLELFSQQSKTFQQHPTRHISEQDVAVGPQMTQSNRKRGLEEGGEAGKTTKRRRSSRSNVVGKGSSS